MSRTLGITFAWIAVSIATTAYAQDRALPPQIPDPNWRPKAGDRVVVRPTGTVGSADRATCERYIRFSNAGDTTGKAEVASAKKSVRIDPGIPVLVIEPHGLPAINDYSTSSAETLNADIQEAIFRAASRPKPAISIEVRVLDGPHKDKVSFVPMDDLASMVSDPTYRAPVVKPAPRPVDPAIRAATIFQSAKNLEKAGKSKPAIEGYRRIVKEFPETPSAKLAATRLRELGATADHPRAK